jgi:hypothetical protein
MKFKKKILKQIKSGKLTEREVSDFYRIYLKLNSLDILPKKTKRITSLFSGKNKKNDVQSTY